MAGRQSNKHGKNGLYPRLEQVGEEDSPSERRKKLIVPKPPDKPSKKGKFRIGNTTYPE